MKWRQIAGALAIDYPRYLAAMHRPAGWVRVVNRHDSVQIDTIDRGLLIDDPWSSYLHLCRIFPHVGRSLLKRATKEWPFELSDHPFCSDAPDITFIIPHRGKERLPLLKKVIHSIRGQNGIVVECIVVEQSQEQEVSSLPEGVRIIHLPHPEGCSKWRKCWAFNEGVKAARADIVVCHDGDILVPQSYGFEILCLLGQEGEGYEVAFPQRFLFYINRNDTERIIRNHAELKKVTPEGVKQNWVGGTLAIRRGAFSRVGGFDERFTGWTGEDREFYDRCLVLRGYRFGYLPFVHLWHPDQETKSGQTCAMHGEFTRKVMLVSREKRIARLVNGRADKKENSPE